jgi:hypothetical protein
LKEIPLAKFFLVLSIIVMIGTGGCGLVFATGGFADAAAILALPPFLVALLIAAICYNVIKGKNEAAERSSSDTDDTKNG